jgi:hypothetical protein
MKSDVPTYYRTRSPITDPGEQASLLDGLPSEVPELVRVVLGLVLHPVAAARMGLDLPPERRRELDLRHVPRMLERIQELDPRPLLEERPPERRLIGNCRDSAVLFCAMLRHQGRPARARAGFATYFQPDFFGDHWVCEHWEAECQRWVSVDPDISSDLAHWGFDSLDVPADRFLVAGRAWLACRAGKADPARFGMPEFPEKNGPGWVASQLVRDLGASTSGSCSVGTRGRWAAPPSRASRTKRSSYLTTWQA